MEKGANMIIIMIIILMNIAIVVIVIKVITNYIEYLRTQHKRCT